MTYTITITLEGVETIVLKTTDKLAAQKVYHSAFGYRVRVNGRRLAIHEADKLMRHAPSMTGLCKPRAGK